MLGSLLLHGALMAPEIGSAVGELAGDAVDGLARRVAKAMLDEAGEHFASKGEGLLDSICGTVQSKVVSSATGSGEAIVKAARDALQKGLDECGLRLVPATDEQSDRSAAGAGEAAGRPVARTRDGAAAIDGEQFTNILRELRRGGWLVVHTLEKSGKAADAERAAASLADGGVIDRTAIEEVRERLVDSTYQLAPAGFYRFSPDVAKGRYAVLLPEEDQPSAQAEVLEGLAAAGIRARRDEDQGEMASALYAGELRRVAELCGCSEEVARCARAFMGWVRGCTLPVAGH